MSVPWSSWPPSSGDVTSVFGRRGAVIAVTGDYEASQVTNDSLVSGAEVSDALNTLQSAVVATALAAGSYPYIQPPLAPNAFDDEFLAGSNPDLAVRGYTVINAATGVVQTRNGNIDPWGAGPPAGTYNSQIIGSWIFIQAPAGIQIDIYKAIVLAAGDTYVARMTGSYNFAPAANGRFNEVGFYAAAGAIFDNNNRVYNTVRDDTTTNFLWIDAARVTGGVLSGTGKASLGGHDIRGIHFDSGTTHTSFVIDSQNGEPKAITVTGAPAAATLVRFGVRNLFSVSGSVVPQIWGIDYIRKKTGNAWLIP